MSYHIDAEKITLSRLQTHIEQTDLVPSRDILKTKLSSHFAQLQDFGIKTLAALRAQLKSKTHIEKLSQATGIDAEYLTLLRREIEGYFPRAFPLSELTWLPNDQLERLAQLGLGNVQKFYDYLQMPEARANFAAKHGFEDEFLNSLFALADLTRVQWVSSGFARVLLLTQFSTVEKMACADAKQLAAAVDEANVRGKFYNAKIGLRDFQRLIAAAQFIIAADFENSKG